MALVVKSPPAKAGDMRHRFNPLEEGLAIYSSILALRIPWTEDPDRLHGVAKSQTQLNNFTFIFMHS